MPKGLWRRVGNTAVPVDDRSLEFLQARKDGVVFVADTNGARNPKQLALWWCLCKLVCEAEDLPSTEKVSDDLKVSLGHADTYVHRDGSEYIKPRSIAFESMSQEEFNQLFKGAIRVIADWLGSATHEVQAQFDAMIADKRYDGMMR
jgi:Protein of unknown function (DUF1367)